MNRFLWTSYGMYFLGGVTSVFFGAIMPELLAHYQATYTSGGFLILLQSIGFIAGVPLTAKLMKRVHYRYILGGAALAVAIAQFGVLSLPRFFWLELLVIVNGMGASSLETSVASYVMELFQGRRAISMSRLEVAFGVGALTMPAAAGGLIAIGAWRFSSLLVGVFALILAAAWRFVSVTLDSSTNEGHQDARTAAPPVFSGHAARYGILLLFLLMIFVYVGVEACLNSFLPSLVQVSLHTRASLASLSASAFWVAMVCGRLAIGWIVRRVSYERYLFGSIVAGIGFFLLLARADAAFPSYLAVIGVGLSMSAIYSITMVYANHTFPGMERTVTSAVTAFAGIGGAVFPFIIGYAMDHLSPPQVLWMILGFAGILLIFFLSIYGSLHVIRQRSRTPLRDG